jgi:hypothetical protein
MIEQISKVENDCEQSKSDYKNIKEHEKNILSKMNKD